MAMKSKYVTMATVMAALGTSIVSGTVATDLDESVKDKTPIDLFDELKNKLHQLHPKAAKEGIETLRQQLGNFPTPTHQDKIDHFVVLYMENHAFDNYLGCMDIEGIDGIPKGGHLIPIDPDNETAGYYNVTCDGEAQYVCDYGPGYDTFAGKFKSGANTALYPYDEQDDRYSGLNGANGGTTTNMFTPEQIPIKAAAATNYGIFNRLYTAVPSASTPNHLFTQSATSCGIHDNILYSDCGGATDTFPQMTIYDSLYVNNVSFGLYINSTCGLWSNSTPCEGIDPHDPESGSTIPTPDVGMSGVGRYADHFYSQKRFYDEAAEGTLPAFSWVMPPFQACDHPCYDVAKGERLLKDMYEALRSSPAWNKTLFFVAYDDAGGYYDHVVPPFEGVPADDAPCHVADTCPGLKQFDFKRLGLRSSAMLMSPWVGKKAVFQEPIEGPYNTSQFDLTSVPATVKNLFNLTGFLTNRDRWSGNFEELLLDTPRDEADMPMHFPEAPDPASPWDAPPSAAPGGKPPTEGGHRVDTDGDEDEDEDIAKKSPIPMHCGRKERTCRGPDRVNVKQERKMKLFSKLTMSELPDMAAMTEKQAEAWLNARWQEWMEAGAPVR
mmetsp:Transcript_94372/g.270274  ORF Transcript_94372/g.270274 Transcript_94372/m.270274 type:complete len:609 (-) Transcript_94372:146-1972(-)